MFDDQGNGLFSTVLLDWIEWEGPLVSVGGEGAAPGLGAAGRCDAREVAEHLQRFAERAWRRPVLREDWRITCKPTATTRRRREKWPTPIASRCREC